jgi:hypothetical protein
MIMTRNGVYSLRTAKQGSLISIVSSTAGTIKNNSYVHEGAQHPSILAGIAIGNAKKIKENPYVHEALRQCSRPAYFIAENSYVHGALREGSRPFKYAARKIANCALKIFNYCLYVHRVVGKNGKPMKIVKIKTMHDGANDHLEQRIKMGGGLCHRGKPNGDEHVIRGRGWMRGCHLDETPQLFDVILGKMRVTGPRPKPLLIWAEFPPEHVERELSIDFGLFGDQYRFPKLSVKDAEEKCMDMRNSRPGSADLNIFLGICYNKATFQARSR